MIRDTIWAWGRLHPEGAGEPQEQSAKADFRVPHHVEYGDKGLLLSRRGEWGQNLPPKRVVDDGEAKGPKRAYGRCKGPEGGREDPTPPPKR